MNHTERLKAALWRRYGAPAYPAEWDHTKLSQRFWEYHTALELLELTPESVVLDIGGGSPATGSGFFALLIAPYVKEAHIMDFNVGETQSTAPGIRLHRDLASYESLSKLLKQNPQITHIASISVFEHTTQEARVGIIKAINEAFNGDIFVATLEYHTRDCFFEHQPTARTLSGMFTHFTSFYPDQILKSPVWAENAYRGGCVGRSILRKLGPLSGWGREPGVPLWYPLALRFRRIAE